MRTIVKGIGLVATMGMLAALPACSDGAEPQGESSAVSQAVSGSALGSLALANVGTGACSTNSLGGHSFYSSCSGNGGQPEYWCADFVKWVWANSGADVTGLSAASGSFYVYGQTHGTLSNRPSVGAAVVFDYQGGGTADHVAIVTKVNGDGTIETVSGDWNGQNGSEAYFSSTSSAVLNAPAYDATVGSIPGIIGMTVSGFIMPAGSGSGSGSGGGGGGGGGGSGGGDCSVHADHKLYCSNTPGAAMHAQTNAESAVVNHVRTSYSWFDCWGTGELHAGGNTTWYHTVGDDNSNAGWVPAVDLSTPNTLDANPTAHGLAQCGGAPPPPPQDPNCSVHTDGRLYCNNTAGAAIRDTATNGGAVVNHLQTTTSWFDCWTTGDLHAGGNTTWYHTLGDDNGNWGFVPAVDLTTASAFDANPSAAGLASCR